MADRDESRKTRAKTPWMSPNSPHEENEGKKLWGIVIFSFIGAAATTMAICQLRQFGRTLDWFSVQLSKMQSGKGGTRSFRSSFQEEARRKYRQRMQEEHEEEMERVERIRRMQSVFNRERNKFQRGYESWKENGPSGGPYHQNAQRDDWYWTSDSSFRDRKTNYRQTPQHSGNYSLSRHYAVLGLERSRVKPYTDEEIKTAFRAKALEYHPDQNQDNKVVAEAKFKEVMVSYEAIKSERKNLKQ
ncbi:uncharacterized protein LOC141586611 [Silene latifolia]|uniref:uncharacterized protein LOC141586611 n=1 Tax=Silene latifolia TaxID=37657 RepID=UPI003D780077